jgi:hypothetical protein
MDPEVVLILFTRARALLFKFTKKSEVVGVTKHRNMQAYMRRGGKPPHILDPDTKWRR